MTIRIAFKKLHKDAVLPKYGTEGSAGFDFHVVEPGKLWPCERVLVKTGLAVQVPEDFELQLRPRSGLALKNGITLTNTPATIDSDYRGEIGIILENRGHEVFEWEAGDRLAQGVISPIVRAVLYEGELDATGRGDGGYGSTGK